MWHRQKEHEGRVTKELEQRTSKLPSAVYLTLAGAAMAGSAVLFLSGRRETGIFVGLWPLALLTIGNYNKLVKLLGSE